MSAHTRGPWFFGLSNRGNEAAIIGDGDTVVCFLPDASTGCTFKPSDARLISAAPELLAELENIANADLSKWAPEVRDQFREWAQSRARAAIAKATGES